MSNIIIDIDGNIIPCFEDYKKIHIMGNINNESLIDIWNKDKYKKFRKELRDGNRLKYDVCDKCISNQIITL
jgi:radical SAM protein with 4Fe4S-binding SPASM domain